MIGKLVENPEEKNHVMAYKEYDMKFTSKNTVHYIEDEVLTIAFADSKDPDPNQYLILQREVNNEDTYYYEVNGQLFSNEGGIKQVKIDDQRIILFFNDNEVIYKNGFHSLAIDYKKDSKLKEVLLELFQDSDAIIDTN